MRSISSGRLAATVSLFALAAAFAPGVAMAKDTRRAEPADPTAQAGEAATAEPVADSAAEDSSETIIVTGSRLRRDERNSPDPVTIIDPSLSEKEGLFQTA